MDYEQNAILTLHLPPVAGFPTPEENSNNSRAFVPTYS